MTRPVASLSLDLDNAWSYLKTRGDERWTSYPSYYDRVVPLALDALDRAGVGATFFIVGRDAAEPAHHHHLRSLAAAGHELGNHSFSHEPWLHLYEDDALVQELEQTEDALEAATGVRPVGFRGPGYSLTPRLLELLAERGYAYDASTLPTWIGPLARAYYFRTAKLSPEERETRSALFGSWRDAIRRITPYRWELPGGRSLVEVPVTTMPLARVPIHVSYVLFLEGRSPALARAYFRGALRACRLTGVAPSILLHPLDLLGADDLPGSGLEFFPAMELGGERKRRLLDDCLRAMAERFDVVGVGEHTRRAGSGQAELPVRVPG